jgi:gliding motility-associated-like protein
MVAAQVELSCGTKQTTKPISIVNCTCKAFVPNLLIANGNGVNDMFEISNLCPTKSFRLRIYNRWGKEVFASENPNEKWDSNTVGSGTYFFAMDLLYESAPPESLKGWVNVVN